MPLPRLERLTGAVRRLGISPEFTHLKALSAVFAVHALLRDVLFRAVLHLYVLCPLLVVV